jgi:hypothetical protein
MRTVIKKALATTEQVTVGDYTIDYNYTVVDNALEWAITATVKKGNVHMGTISTSDNVVLNNNLRITQTTDYALIIEQVKIDFDEILAPLDIKEGQDSMPV